MGKLRIGCVYIKPLYIVLLVLGLLTVIGGIIILINPTAVGYEHVWEFKEADINGARAFEFSSSLAKGQVLRGKLEVETGMAIMAITAQNQSKEVPRRVVDSGEIQAGKSFRFSLKSDWTYTSYQGLLVLTSDANAKFYCNSDVDIKARPHR